MSSVLFVPETGSVYVATVVPGRQAGLEVIKTCLTLLSVELKIYAIMSS